MADQLNSVNCEKGEVKAVSPKPKKWAKFLKLVDVIALILAISLGVATVMTKDDPKTFYMTLAIIPAFYLASRALYFIKEAKKSEKTANPVGRKTVIRHWVEFGINFAVLIGNAIAVVVRIFWLR